LRICTRLSRSSDSKPISASAQPGACHQVQEGVVTRDVDRDLAAPAHLERDERPHQPLEGVAAP
jgi:hypothetical protein